MKFTKMHGLGNDYVYIDCFHEVVDNPQRLAVKMSDRHFGVGSDGLVLIEPSEVADAKMRMFNADGSEAEMCGNAIRCVGKYFYENHQRKTTLKIETLAGIKELSLKVADNQVIAVTVNMGAPILENAAIPVAVTGEQLINYPIEVNNHCYQFTAVSMGNPHCVIFVPEITDAMVLGDGPLLEKHPLFPKRTNVEFVKLNDDASLTMRVWERGSGETLACGTGACAVTVAAILNNYIQDSATIHLQGGDLEISWQQPGQPVYMTGSATTVFSGYWYL
ncbi:MAG TPA: diaminopimelate epimerase [Bacillota bacterium]|nr:diaminopimelate epimerase [Bacillota bacterium]HOL10617.1 diaminopimelate epimerase [Bacillota bacterium]HPO98578.1 diaminopimelate epimerase [Bacillota bacterium]